MSDRVYGVFGEQETIEFMNQWYQNHTNFENTNQQANVFMRGLVQHLPQEIKRQIQSNSILDWGCGAGQGCAVLQETFPDCDVIGYDISHVAIEKARITFPHCSYTNKLEQGNPFDVVITSHCLEHFASPRNMAKQIAMLAKTFCIILVPFRGRVVQKIGNHISTITEDTFPTTLGNMEEVFRTILHTKHWNGPQLLVVYQTKQHSPSIGLLALTDPTKGLYRDAQNILWALQQPHSPHDTGVVPKVSVFPVERLDVLDATWSHYAAPPTPETSESTVPPGTLLADWLGSLDVLVVFETFLPRVFQQAAHSGVRVVYIPNVDWACLPGEQESASWIQQVAASNCVLWAKTPHVEKALRAVGLKATWLPWSIPDPILPKRKVRTEQEIHQDGIRFLVNGGMGGWKQRRGLDLALQAAHRAYTQDKRIRLRIKTIVPLQQLLPNWQHLAQDLPVELFSGLESREQMQEHYLWADALLYPTRWDGFGLSLLEALHTGLPCIATDGWPMNELVRHEHNGLLVPAQPMGSIRLATHWECDIDALAKAMLRMLEDSSLRQRLTCPDPSDLLTRQHEFVAQVKQQLSSRPTPTTKKSRINTTPEQSDTSSHKNPVDDEYTIKIFLQHLHDNSPFAYARFNDGEMIGISSVGSVVSRGAQPVGQELSASLLESLCYEQKEYWKGIPCRQCFPDHRLLAEQLTGLSYTYLTSATLLNNRNYTWFRQEFPTAVAHRHITWIGGNDQQIQKLPFPVDEYIELPVTNAWSYYPKIREHWKKLPEKHLVMLSCGPLGRILARQWFEQRPDCTFIDVGSLFDPETRGVQHRYHQGTLPPCPECH